MAIFDLYSKRRKAAVCSGQPDVYRYDEIPPTFRVQIVHIWGEALGSSNSYQPDHVEQRWKMMHDILAREMGVFDLTKYAHSYEQGLINWFLGSADVDGALDAIELTFRVIERMVDTQPDYIRQQQGVRVSANDAIEELNARFQEQGIGYQYVNAEIVRIDSQYLHAEVTRPALALLAEPGFSTANDDFMGAHRHYRNGEFKDCVVASQRAFESTLKAICAKRKWNFEKGDRLPELVKLVRQKGLFPDFLDSGFDTYVAMLKTGLPGVRNNAGGHGRAPTEADVPGYLAAYALHMTATNIVMAMEASKHK